jgi:hypothetical protein
MLLMQISRPRRRKKTTRQACLQARALLRVSRNREEIYRQSSAYESKPFLKIDVARQPVAFPPEGRCFPIALGMASRDFGLDRLGQESICDRMKRLPNTSNLM